MRKNFRTLLLKGGTSFQTYSTNLNSAKIKKKLLPYTFQEFYKKEHSYDSNPFTINFLKSNSQNIKPKICLIKNIKESSGMTRKYPLINNNSIINNRNKLFNSFNDYLSTPKIRSKLIRKEKYKTNIFKSNKNKLILNSIEVNKNDYPKYIFLSKIFTKSDSKTKKVFFPMYSGKTNKERVKSYKIKNNEIYKNYISKRVKLNYNNNFDSSFVHKIKSEFMLKKLSKKYPIKKENNHENEYSDEDKEIIKEKRDIVDENILNNDKIFKKIKNELFNQNKKYIIGNETKVFFEKKENRINYLYDINLLPNFKNNLLRESGITFQRKLEEENYIENKNWRYLNKAKIRLQKLKDDKSFNEYVLCEEEEDLNKEKNNQLENEETSIDNNNKKFKEKYESYEIEDYLSKKKENQSVVRIIDLKTKKMFYGTFIKMHNKNK